MVVQYDSVNRMWKVFTNNRYCYVAILLKTQCVGKNIVN
jgi:hypothetical protein